MAAVKGKIGCPTRIITAVPHIRELAKGEKRELSQKAKFRLKVIDYYLRSSAEFSKTRSPDVTLTCRHFGIHRSYFYRWLARFDARRLSALENRSSAPKKKREPEYSRELAKRAREIRKENPTYSRDKTRAVLLRETDADAVPSASTIGRLINRENGFGFAKHYFRADVKRHKKHAKASLKAHERKRKPRKAALEAEAQAAGKKIIEFDMKHVYLLGKKQYAFCAVDIRAKEAVVHVASTPSSANARNALEKIVSRFGKDIVIVNDNGSVAIHGAT
jgi:transposase